MRSFENDSAFTIPSKKITIFKKIRFLTFAIFREILISRTYQDIFELRIHNGRSRPGDEGSLFCVGIGRERTNSSPSTQPMGVHCQQVIFFLSVRFRNKCTTYVSIVSVQNPFTLLYNVNFAFSVCPASLRK